MILKGRSFDELKFDEVKRDSAVRQLTLTARRAKSTSYDTRTI